VNVPHLWFASPRLLPRAEKLQGRVVVLDIAFAATVGTSVSFELTRSRSSTGSAIASRRGSITRPRTPRRLQARSALRAVDEAEHGACPEMVTPELVRQTGPIDTICTHVDLDGLYAAAKWVLGGNQPYPAPTTTRAPSTRASASPGPIGTRMITRCARSFATTSSSARSCTTRRRDEAGHERRRDPRGRGEFERKDAVTQMLAKRFTIRGASRSSIPTASRGSSNKTDLLLAVRRASPCDRARLGPALDRGRVRLGLGLRDDVRARRRDADARDDSRDELDDAVAKINDAPLPTPRSSSGRRVMVAAT